MPPTQSSQYSKKMSIPVLPKMLKDKELHIMTLDDKSVVYEMGNFGLNDDDFETMGFTEVYGITKRIALLIGHGILVILRKNIIVL